jgi:hypothetical protein
VLKAMLCAKLKSVLLCMTTAVLLTTGVGVLAQQSGPGQSADDRLKAVERKLDRLLEVLGGSSRQAATPTGLAPATAPTAPPVSDAPPGQPGSPSGLPTSAAAPAHAMPSASNPMGAPPPGFPQPSSPAGLLTRLPEQPRGRAGAARAPEQRQSLVGRVQALEQRLAEFERRIAAIERRLQQQPGGAAAVGSTGTVRESVPPAPAGLLVSPGSTSVTDSLDSEAQITLPNPASTGSGRSSDAPLPSVSPPPPNESAKRPY